MKSKSKGFTLIELLVVIAIIGILASIVLVSFPGATKKAKDARIMGAIGQARTVMVYIYANEGAYTKFACADADYTEMATLCKEIDANYGDDVDKTDMIPEPVINVGVDADDNPAACIYSPLNSGGFYCADSIGVAGTTVGDVDPGGTVDTYCNGTSAVCPPVEG